MSPPVRGRPEATVVVVGSRVPALRRTAAMAADAGRPVIVGWLGRGPRPRLDGARVRECFPLGSSYAVNRCLPLVETTRVVVVRQGLGASPWHFERDALIAVGGLDHALPLEPALVAASAALSGGTHLGRLVTGGARWIGRRSEGRPSPRGPLAVLPPAVGVAAEQLQPLTASVRTKSHLLFRAPGGRVLHLYADPSPRLLRGVVDREHVRLRAPGARVPVLHAAVPGRDSLWVLEDEVDGAPLDADPARWWSEAADWLVDVAGPPGPELRSSALWPSEAREALLAVPQQSRAAAAEGLAAVGRWPSRHQHGDLQPRNVVRTASGLSAVDWEGVWVQGVPGLDVLFLALLARPGGPAPDLLPALVAGGDSSTTPVRPALDRLGVRGPDVAALVRACLALWTRGERRRTARLGALVALGSASRVFRDMWATLPGTPEPDG